MPPERGKINSMTPNDEDPWPGFYVFMFFILVLVIICDWLLMTAQVIPM